METNKAGNFTKPGGDGLGQTGELKDRGQAKAGDIGLYPFSFEDEAYVIGLMYHNVAKAEEILTKLEEDDFYNKFNRDVFKIARLLTDSGTFVSSHNVIQEYARSLKDEGEEQPFNMPTIQELESRYHPESMIIDVRRDNGLEGAIRRIKQDVSYREIVHKAQDAIMQASIRGGDPIEIVAGLETLSYDLQKKNSSVIIWADEAEKAAQETYDKLDRGDMVAHPSGFPELDKLLYGGGFWGGDLVVVSGATSGGKTTFALNLADNAGERGVRSLYFTMEMKTFKVFSRIHARKAKVPGYKIRPLMSELYGSQVRDKLRSTGEAMARLPIGFIDSVKDMETIRRISKFAVREHGVQEIYIDYMGLATPSKRFKGSRYDRASAVSETCKEIAIELDVPVVALSQLRRSYKEEKAAAAEDGGNPVEPNLDMLKESGSIENDADTVIFLWGEKAREGEELAIRNINGKIAKQRNGMLGRFELKFAPDIFTFSSMEQLAERPGGTF